MPQALREAFSGRTYLPTPELAAVLEMDVTTLRRHADAGDINWHQKGLGAKRPRRVFTLDDAVGFLQKMRGASHRSRVRRMTKVTHFLTH